ncbi:MAG: DNA methyltransferase, partial [Armatimonadota bacterium]
MAKNTLYYGDNLQLLRNRDYFPDAFVDLVYLDPPFNSSQDYNVLFKERDGTRSTAQVKAFKDTWGWDQEASRAYTEMVEHGPEQVSKALRAFQTFLGFNDMLAYLSMMAPRLVELRRVLKPTGSIYLHCDLTASHYLKMLMDAVFGPVNFRNEIVWRRAHPKGHAFTRFATSHDVILAYAADARVTTWNPSYLPHDPDRVAEQYSLRDTDGRPYQLTSLLNPNPNRPNLTYEFLGVTRVWRWTRERMEEEYRKGRIVVPRDGQGIPRYKRYLDEQEGIPIGDFWGDIEIASGSERLGYPTQKPEALLERILLASSNEGDLVLDPFCGCGTTIAVAQRLDRRWIGIDITCLAINLMRRRLESAFQGKADFEVIGEPTAYSEAEQLAKENPYQFQWWALDLVGARPAPEAQKKGADKGIDGRIIFFDDESGDAKQIIISVKAGHINVSHVRDLRGVLDREKAQIGCLICLEEPTHPMRAEAAGAGFYQSPLGNKMYPRLQLLTIKQLLEGNKLQAPEARLDVTFKKAPRAKKASGQK